MVMCMSPLDPGVALRPRAVQVEAEQAQAAALRERDQEHSNSMRLLDNGYRQHLQVCCACTRGRSTLGLASLCPRVQAERDQVAGLTAELSHRQSAHDAALLGLEQVSEHCLCAPAAWCHDWSCS